MTEKDDFPRDPETGETRAGPGDAGASDHPRLLPKLANEGARSARAVQILAVLVGIGVIVAVIRALAG